MLSHSTVNEFKDIYKAQFNENLSDSEAYEKANALLRLFKLIYQPIPKNWQKELDKKYAKSK